MDYKTIVLLIERDWRPELLEIAFTLARDMQAHLVGLHTMRPVYLPPHVLAEAGPSAETMLASQREAVANLEKKARDAFESASARFGHRTIEWRVAKQDPLDAMVLSARYADLVIAAQPVPGEDWNGEAHRMRDSLTLLTGRPVLFVPYAGTFPTIGKKVLVAWDAGRESARAVADSHPFLSRAQWVRVAVFNAGHQHGDEPGADIGLHLARHGIKVATVARVNKDVGVGELILSEAADCGADLLVMGAYGHSRIRELALGGATRTLLESMTLPVLMSH